jgi:hypothetical protein
VEAVAAAESPETRNSHGLPQTLNQPQKRRNATTMAGTITRKAVKRHRTFHNKTEETAFIVTMDMRKGILSLLLLLSVITATAQSFTLTGKVSDEDGNAIELATISCLEQGAVTMANLKGEFSLKLHTADSVAIKFSMVGYQTRTRVLRKPKGNQRLLITLHPMKALDEVVVTERR